MSGSTSPQIAIRITAVDAAATKHIDALNKRIAAINGPTQALTKSLGKLSDTTGITTLGKGMRGLARESLTAFENLGRISGPLGVITGAASLAGLARLSSEWANYGAQLGFTAARTGVSVERLGALQGAARLAGSSAGSMSSGLKALRDNMTGLNTGTAAPETAAAFNMLHIATRNADGSMRSTAAVLPEIADKIAAIKDPTIQARYATMLLGSAGEDLLPILRKGSAGLVAYTEKARKYGLLNADGAKAADDLRQKQVELTLATEGLGYSIAQELSPVMAPMLDDLTKWIGSNRQLIATDVAGWISDYKGAFSSVKGVLDPAVASMGGWNRVLEIAAPLMLARVIPGVGALENALIRLAAVRIPFWLLSLLGVGGGAAAAVGAGAVGMLAAGAVAGKMQVPMVDDYGRVVGNWGGKDESQNPAAAPGLAAPRTADAGVPPTPTGNPIWNWVGAHLPAWAGGSKAKNPADPAKLRTYFKSQGWSDAQIAGILGNFQAESGFDAAAPGDHGAAAGLGQWRDSRRQMFRLMFGHDVSQGTPMEQAQFTQWELTHTEKAAGDKLRAATTPREAGAAFSLGYERPADGGYQAAVRGQYAESWAQKIAQMPTSPPADIQGGSGAAPASPATAPTQTLRGGANLTVTLNGFPAGTQTSATTDGNVFAGAPKVEHAMPGNGP